MANPRQRRKVRSSSYKPIHHSRRAKKILKKQPAIRGPQVLQEAWDKHKTVRQNYAALGLSASLNPRTSGGVERVASDTEAQLEADVDTDMTCTEAPSSSSQGPSSGDLSKGLGRIVRDEDGNIIDVEIQEDDEQTSPQEEQLIEDRASALVLVPDTLPWVALGRNLGREPEKTEVVQALEQVSSSPVVRFSSKSEVALLRRLCAKHGDDTEAMARDRKLNVDQRTAGELSRAIRKAGGFAKLGTHAS
ncbi:hypothetical protein BV25DRAFT_1869904 [Artomyces pyxidatus]|uniref:Uncharacterized protein n=1 Tax=Artomyces pyxidatus TaxID=48021 RepID=A0ACB8T413_9AGAM|nr:hypothetical protein BV25DRAFT_1869904 [Artomyces pyxidatus]